MRSDSLTRLKFRMAEYLFAKPPDVNILSKDSIFKKKIKIVSTNYKIKHRGC